MNADAVTSCRVGKGALADLSAWAKSLARRAHAATPPQTILPTLRTETDKQVARLAFRKRRREAQIADVCLIVEGAYPYVSGGVSAWVHGLMLRQPDLKFCVVAILPEPPPPARKYGPLPNLQALHHLYL